MGSSGHEPAVLLRICVFLLVFFPFLALVAADCEWTPTTCSCRYEASPSGICLKPHPSKPNICTQSNCSPSWRCDCQNATHICSRTTCSSYQRVVASPVPTPVPSPGEVVCATTTQTVCVSETGAPIAPLAKLSPSPSATPSMSLSPSPTPSNSPALAKLGEACSVSEDCPNHVGCISGICRSNQICDSVMRAHCEGLGHVCCDYMLPCPLYMVQWDEAVCAKNCGEFCMLHGSYIECVWRKGGDYAYTLLWDTVGGFGGNVPQCSIMT